ncbi:MAG: type II toxin-antitoxin system HipA family toxin, partial [Bacteroidota bacterium]
NDSFRQLITEFRPYGPMVMPFFSNLLPEGRMRDYLAERAGVNPEREFFLLWALGSDLPGAITIRPVDGDELPPMIGNNVDHNHDDDRGKKVLRFSLAGVQVKFSAIIESKKDLTIPARGVGGSWIVKLPSREYEGVPENEYSMMTLARQIGMDVPAIDLVDVSSIQNLPPEIETLEGQAFIIERFDRLDDGSAIHIEDFGQIFGIYPHDKYKNANYANIGEVVAAESSHDDIAEFIRRLTFNTLIGNADMHVKNWSMRYLDRRNAVLAPAYDFVATIAYLPDEAAALNFSRKKRFDEFTEDELAHMANRAAMPKSLVLDTAKETVELFHQYWNSEKTNLPLRAEVIEAVEAHVKKIPLT